MGEMVYGGRGVRMIDGSRENWEEEEECVKGGGEEMGK